MQMQTADVRERGECRLGAAELVDHTAVRKLMGIGVAEMPPGDRVDKGFRQEQRRHLLSPLRLRVVGPGGRTRHGLNLLIRPRVGRLSTRRCQCDVQRQAKITPHIEQSAEVEPIAPTRAVRLITHVELEADAAELQT